MFDLVARDRKHTLCVELKLSGARGGRMPNSDLQRLLGQCALASAKHTEVIGVFVYRGRLNSQADEDTGAVRRWFEGRNVRLVVRGSSPEKPD